MEGCSGAAMFVHSIEMAHPFEMPKFIRSAGGAAYSLVASFLAVKAFAVHMKNGDSVRVALTHSVSKQTFWKFMIS